MNVLVSSCLLGIKCRYDGNDAANEKVLKLRDKYNLIPICPEVLGGMNSPRECCEIVCGKVLTQTGEDVTSQFNSGANLALEIAKRGNCKYAILKQKSPSCGFGEVYDGTFSGETKEGSGITAQLFEENGIKIIADDEFTDL